jgi:dephospho-CoA kinase
VIEGRRLLIGLTGPIGCGKSTVARMLADRGALVIDADTLSRQVTETGTPAAEQSLPAIRARFGDAVFDDKGELKRAALAKQVFSDPTALAGLEAIIHPLVRGEVERLLSHAELEQQPIVVIEAIKLVEGGLAERCDEVWLVDCAPAVQRQRLRDRRQAADDIERRIATQGEGLVERLAELLAPGQRVRRLRTDTDLETVRAQVDELLADALAPTETDGGG